MKITWCVETDVVGGTVEGEIEVKDDLSDDQIYTAVENDVWNYMSLSWKREDAK